MGVVTLQSTVAASTAAAAAVLPSPSSSVPNYKHGNRLCALPHSSAAAASSSSAFLGIPIYSPAGRALATPMCRCSPPSSGAACSVPRSEMGDDNGGGGAAKAGKAKARRKPSQKKRASSSAAVDAGDEGRREIKSQGEPGGSGSSTAATTQEQQQTAAVASSVVSLSRLSDVNPVGLGRKSRQMFDEVWRKFSELGQLSRTSTAMADEALLDPALIRGPMCEFTIPGAQDTTVLVVGATSRVGRIVVRKLMLRGYNVKALVRRTGPEVVEMLPRSVDIVVGDVGDPSTLSAAVEGCNKIIYCATARSAITGDLNRVDYQGVCNVTRAFQDYNNKLAQLRAGKSSKSKLLLAKFKSEESLQGWEVRQGTYFRDVVDSKYDGGMDAKFEFTEAGDAVFSGYVFTRGGYVELSKRLSLPLGSTLDRYDGLVLSVGGNGRSFILILEAGPLADTSQSKLYFTRLSTKVGFCRVRVPFSAFRPVKPDDPPLDPFLVHTITLRFEPRRQRPIELPGGVKQDLRSFKLIMEYIKALPVSLFSVFYRKWLIHLQGGHS